MTEKCLICNSSSDFLFSKIDWNNEFHFYKCRNCTHVFIYPLPSTNELDSYYNHDYYVPDFQRLKVRKKGAFVLKYLTNKKNPMLEIGSSYGYFLEFMQEQGVKIEGLELSQKASQSAIDKGFTVNCGSIENINIQKEFQAIFLLDVFEHIPNPQSFLKIISKKLATNGEIFLTLPNQNSLEFRLFKKYWEWVSPPAHLHFFNAKSITELFNQNGFTVDVVESFKGDSSGNIFFHFYDFLRRIILFNVGYLIYGRKRFLEKKKAYNLQQKEKRQFNSREFSGITFWVYTLTNIFNFADKIFRNKLNEPTLFFKATKNEPG